MVVPGCASWLEAIGSEMALDDAAVELDTALDEVATELETMLEDAAAELETALEDAATELDTALDEAAAELETALDEAATELETALDEAAAELDTALDEAAAELEVAFVAELDETFVVDDVDVAWDEASVGWLDAGRTGTASSSLQAGKAIKSVRSMVAKASHASGCRFMRSVPPSGSCCVARIQF